MEEGYKVVYTGKLKEGVESEEVVARLTKTFSLPAARAQALVADGQRHTLKKGLDEEAAKRYRAALESTGMIVEIEPRVASVGRLELVPLEGETADEPEVAAPGAGPQAGTTDGFNRFPKGVPTQTPGAAPGRTARPDVPPGPRIEPALPAREPPDADQPGVREMRDPQAVPAGRGWGWIAGGFSHFTGGPWTWILASLVVMVIPALLVLGPYLLGLDWVGTLLSSAVWVVFVGGFMVGANAQDRGEDFRMGHLFAGFGEKLLPLSGLGLAIAAGELLIALVVTGALRFLVPPAADLGTGLEPAATTSLLAFLAPLLLGLVLGLCLGMASYFAPALVMLDGLGPAQAMGKSFVGCLRNILPLFVFGLLSILLLIPATLLLGLGLLVLLPTLVAATYVGYKDIFFD